MNEKEEEKKGKWVGVEGRERAQRDRKVWTQEEI